MPNLNPNPNPNSNEREYLHVLLMGRPGAGKSTMAATFPTPMLVLGYDPAGKERAYMDLGKAGPITKGDHCYFREVFDRYEPGKLLVRYEYWGEPNPFKPTAYPRFVARSVGLEADIAKLGYRTVIADTATYFELSARSYSEGSINKEIKDGRQHFAFSTHACEQYLMMRLPNLLLCNSIVICHIDDQKDEADDGGVVIRKMAALPGKLPNRIAGGFGEVWRVYFAGRTKEGVAVHRLQTQRRSENNYDCKSLMHIKDDIAPNYSALWQ